MWPECGDEQEEAGPRLWQTVQVLCAQQTAHSEGLFTGMWVESQDTQKE